ncbi:MULTISPECIES: N-acetylmuramoyl-L-alanine amidase [unclassified Frankia]|uniref:peptidoglycan recognition protein family protein n=1 Tax=unclassified Frankia TaxID=2632575 RepID=UPI001EF472A5|nr:MULTISPECIES: N-acetylmuramoyl-L-alanine amidase [unclassified Frankia]
MEQLLPGTLWRPLSADNTEPVIVPRILVLHTMVGYLLGTESMFRQGGYTGTESTFGVGGPWDGDAYDGVVFQWQLLGRQADAQYAGNDYANSVETSDGGDSSRPWSDKQLRALIALAATWCHQTGNPCQLVSSPDQSGIGYHDQFPEWNRDRHECPGAVRKKQLIDIVIPGAVALLPSTPRPVSPIVVQQPVVPMFPLPVGHWYGTPDPDPCNHSGVYNPADRAGISRWQAQMHARGWEITVDGIFGPQTRDVCVRFQQEKGLAVDGRVGPVTWAAAWSMPVVQAA